MDQKNELKNLAQNNLFALAENLYPGRGIIIGMDSSGKFLVQVYWLMGRSENSRNRIFKIDETGFLITAPVDSRKVRDSSLTIYTAMAEAMGSHSVSNGAQTLDALSPDGLEALTKRNWRYEPDDPNFTPRITAVISPKSFGTQFAQISILKKSPFDNECAEYLYKLPITEPGLGYCVTTYDSDGNPVPAFSGDPYLLPLEGDIKHVAQSIWNTLDESNRVSLAVKFIGINEKETKLHIINKHVQVHH